MKKVLFIAALLLGTVAAQAQLTLEGSKLTDNWSVTLKGGAISPFQHYAFFKNARGIFGAEVRKQVTPILGLGVEGEWTVNTSSWLDLRTPVWGGHSCNILDHQFVGGFGTINLTNLFQGYKGAPRGIEFEAVAGAGWLHGYKHGNLYGDSEIAYLEDRDENSWYTKYGVNINYTCGSEDQWTFSFKPAVIWDMNGDASRIERKLTNAQQSRYNANNAAVELEVGLTYHFRNSNGSRHFTVCPKQYTQADIDALNAEINALRNRQPEVIEKVVERIVEKPVEVQNTITNTITNNNDNYEINVYFKVGKSTIGADQVPNVERVAIFMKNHKDAIVDIKGYASPEGPEDLNIRLANERAKAVKDMLVNKFGIKANRIQAEGQGIGNMFSELEWNRVSICHITVKE